MVRISWFRLALLWAILCASAYCQQNVSPGAAKKAGANPTAAPSSQESKSQWNAIWENWGITADVYNANHLSRLEPDSISNVAIAAWTKGFSDGETFVSPTCGPTGKNPDRSTVKFFLAIPDDIDSEVASGLRSRLRAFSDVRLVFSKSEADAILGILALKNKLKNSSEALGYTLAYYASRPCTIGTNGLEFDFVLSTDLETAPSVSELVQSVAATIDASVGENVRKWNAELAKTEKKVQ